MGLSSMPTAEYCGDTEFPDMWVTLDDICKYLTTMSIRVQCKKVVFVWRTTSVNQNPERG